MAPKVKEIYVSLCKKIAVDRKLMKWHLDIGWKKSFQDQKFSIILWGLYTKYLIYLSCMVLTSYLLTHSIGYV